MSVTQRSTSVQPKPFPWVGLIALSAATFLSVTGEMIPTGLLPDMSASLDVSESQIGLLVTVFAFTVVVSSAPLTMLTRRMPRHALIVGVLFVLAVSSVLTALAPGYGFVVVSRVIGGLAHGLFWSVVGAYAGHLVPKEQIGRAVSITISGGTLAFVLGVPLGTALGHAFGWRLAFGALAVLLVVGAVLVWRFLPTVDRADAAAEVSANPGRRRDSTVWPVLLVCTITAITMTGHYAFYTYIAPYLIDVVGVDPGTISTLLFGYGVAGVGGLVLAGSVFGPRPQIGLISALLVCGVFVAVLAAAASLPVVAIVAFLLWGLAFGALPPLLQTRLLHTASAAFRDTASAIYTTAFNVGIGAGALVGALAFDGLGVGFEPYVYLGFVAVALVLVLSTTRRRRVGPAAAASA
ncbi:MFS transporter [Compostimonas suwonensis]|uniref:Putative MFS family arabinose efflux permease n=1 Tax=Compostimonas suwonensis TaxID=1048394 RepID=A0A2M9BVD6_9MICO|nr:MFS transporter [Compostimonas suwonensis]PJJ61911.1 putative MFS family arabinose efflux permease [Compostimonas suwonensis]